MKLREIFENIACTLKSLNFLKTEEKTGGAWAPKPWCNSAHVDMTNKNQNDCNTKRILIPEYLYPNTRTSQIKLLSIGEN